MKEPSRRELFRYARVKAPRVLCLASRLKNIRGGKNLLTTTDDARRDAARKIVSGGNYIATTSALSIDYLAPFGLEQLPESGLPRKSDIVDMDAYTRIILEERSSMKRDLEGIYKSLFAAIVLQHKEDKEFLSHWLLFLEAYPKIGKMEKRMAYAPVVTQRFQQSNPPESKAEDLHVIKSIAAVDKSVLTKNDILVLWDEVNRYRTEKLITLQQEIESTSKRPFSGKMTAVAKPATKRKRTSPPTSVPDPAAIQKFASEKRDQINRLKTAKENIKNAAISSLVAEMIKDQKYLNGSAAIAALLEREGIDASSVLREISSHKNFETLLQLSSNHSARSAGRMDACTSGINDPCMAQIAQDHHSMDGRDSVKPLGEADLIVVEENWVKYSPGEISAIETVMKNERREKVVQQENIFETLIESATEEMTENEAESKITTVNELSQQIADELKSRMQTDVNSSVSGSGGGSIGVVDFSGEGSLEADVGIGLDASVSSTETSKFSNEIVSRALEKTRRTVSERRMDRTFRRYQTSHTHEINNIGSNSQAINGVFCYLDKHICITERQYGIRQFLIADIRHPGRDLLAKELQRRSLNLNDLGIPPVFDISPREIDETNYLELVGRYRAANIDPPPPLIKMESRVYKTDTTNESKDQNDSKLKKVTEVLVPFFGEYKRFLIQDKIEIPKGYLVQEVLVTVTHGSNGVSIPAHLPFSLAGAMIYGIPKLALCFSAPAYALYLPIALAEIMYVASPVLHYNADSSNCSVTIGHETKESSYFFFQPDDLIARIANLAAGFPQLSEDTLTQLAERINTFLNDISVTLNNELESRFDDTAGSVSTLINTVRLLAAPILEFRAPTAGEIQQIKNFIHNGAQDLINKLTNASLDLSGLFGSVKMLLSDIQVIIRSSLLQAFIDELHNLFSVLENSDHLAYCSQKGFTGQLPISFNCIALKPGVTINLTAKMVRIDDEALDAWRMDTFDRLNQAYYQLEADYSAKQMQSNSSIRPDSPGQMRREELEVVKDRVMKSLDKLHPYSSSTGGEKLERYKLFEHAIDWDNLSYRLYNYGPKGIDLVYEKLGLFARADDRRKTFMKALWSQALIPLKEDGRLESYMMAYIHSGQVTTLDELIDTGALPDDEVDEIAAIYRDVILRREMLNQEPNETYRDEIVPTDLMIIYDGVENLNTPVNTPVMTRHHGSETA